MQKVSIYKVKFTITENPPELARLGRFPKSNETIDISLPVWKELHFRRHFLFALKSTFTKENFFRSYRANNFPFLAPQKAGELGLNSIRCNQKLSE